jgi:hypothetical protein
MDDEPCSVYSTKHYENIALWQTPVGEFLCKVTASKLPWSIPMVRMSHNYLSDFDQ